MAGLYHGWSDEPGNHADFKHGGVDPDDFYKEVNYSPRKKKTSKAKKTFPGCDGNGGKAHIYVWTSEFNSEDLFSRYFGFHKYEKRYCCGCGKRQSGYRFTEKYNKKFKSPRRWSSPEYGVEGFQEYRRRWLTQHGYTKEWYGGWW